MQANDAAMGTKTDCLHCPLRLIGYFREFTPAELEFIKRFKVGEFHVEPGASIISEKTNSAHLYTVLEGWAFRYKTLEDGNRQILNFALPGDFIGLQSSMFGEMDHSVDALSNLTLCVFSRDKIWELFKNHPSLAFDVTWLATEQEKRLGGHLTTIGQRPARSRIAYVLLQLYRRCESMEMAKSDRMPVPFNQQHLADLLGLSLVHTNKTLKRMEASKLIAWKKGVIHLADREALMTVAQLDDQEPPSRPFI